MDVRGFTKRNLRFGYDIVRSIHHGAIDSKWRKNYEEQNKACHESNVSASYQIAKLYVDPSIKRLNLIFKSFNAETLNNSKELLITATKFATEKHFALRIISRNSLPNPKIYNDFAISQKLTMPESITFYTDCAKRVSMPTYRLEVTKEDAFFNEDEIAKLKEFIKNEK